MELIYINNMSEESKQKQILVDKLKAHIMEERKHSQKSGRGSELDRILK